jgi:hypothetical protein
MPQLTNGALQCPTIRKSQQIENLKFQDLYFTPFVFGEYKRNNELKYLSISATKNVIGVYIIKDISSNKLIRLGSSMYDLYEQISLFVQHYKITSGRTSISFLKVEPELIGAVVQKIRSIHRLELIDDAFSKIVPVVLNEKPVPLGAIDFFSLYNNSPVGPRTISRVKSNIAHLRERLGLYILQMSPRGKSSWHIEYVGKASDLHKRIHAHFIKSQAEYRPTSNYYHLRESHDFKIGIIEFPIKEKGLVPRVEKYLISQWDPPGNRYGRGLSKEEIAVLSLGGWQAVEGEAF